MFRSAGARDSRSVGLLARQLTGSLSKLLNGADILNQSLFRSNIYAAPLDALAYNGLQINGSMDVNQGSSYVVDGWNVSTSGTVVIAKLQVADAPPGYTNSLKIVITTPKTTLGATDFVFVIQGIEGYRIAQLGWGTANAQPITIGFRTKIHRVGTYSGSIQNGAKNRSYPFIFTQNVADTWEWKTVTIPGDMAGTWNTISSVGLYINFTMASGTTYVGTAGAWAASNLLGVTGTTNGVFATTDIFQITGVIVVPGLVVPSAAYAPLIMRPFDQELQICRRYYQLVYGSIRARDSGGYCGLQINFTPPMRATPSLGTLTDGGSCSSAGSFNAYNYASAVGVGVEFYSGTYDYYNYGFTVPADARI